MKRPRGGEAVHRWNPGGESSACSEFGIANKGKSS